jgi:DNA-binding NtrC family response regulator
MKRDFSIKLLVMIGVFKYLFSGMPFALFLPKNIFNTLKGKRMDLFKKLQEFRILLVDDDESIRDSLSLFFQGEGCDLIAVRTAEEAIDALALADYDIIISDFRLPGMDGMELFKQTKKSHPQAMKILITAYGSEELAASAIRMGIDDFIQKPLTTNAIEASLAAVLQKYENRGGACSGNGRNLPC